MKSIDQFQIQYFDNKYECGGFITSIEFDSEREIDMVKCYER